jgi:fructoselysine-6-P-deglycase FrlB-like protein
VSDRTDFVNKRAVSVETMLSAIERQAELVGGVVRSVGAQANRVVEELPRRGIRNVSVTGCGDSLYAALAARLAFDLHSGCRMEPVEALEFSRSSAAFPSGRPSLAFRRVGIRPALSRR